MTTLADPRAELLAAIALARPQLDTAGDSGADQAEALTTWLYTTWFTRSSPGGSGPRDPPDRPSLVARLQAAHAATATYELGWRAVSIGRPGELLVARAGERRTVQLPDYVNVDRPAAPVRPGDAVAVSARRDFVDRTDGWWFADGVGGPAPAAPMVRLYWNCPASAAPEVVAALTAALEASSARYSLKCPVTATLFARLDAVVLYLGPDAYLRRRHVLRAAHGTIADLLEPATPPFTLRLGRGVSLAEDPGDGQSYGQSRCAAVAAGLVAGRAANRDTDDELAAAVRRELAAHDIDPDRPWSRASSPAGWTAPW